MSKQTAKITGYIPPELKEQFEAWMAENNVRSESQGVWLALQWFFSGKKPLELIGEEAIDLYESVQILQHKVEELDKSNKLLVESLYSAGAKQLAPLMAEREELPSKFKELDFTENEIYKGLTKTELCQKLGGFSISQVNNFAEKLGLSPDNYLEQVTGCKTGEGARPRFFPAKS